MEPVATSYLEFLSENGFEFEGSPFEERAYVVMGNDGYHLDEDGYGDFAYDLQLTDDTGRRFSGTGAQNTDHFVWDAIAVAPIGGTIFEIVEGGVDNPPGTYPEGAVNNLVGIRLGGNFYAYLLHFRQDGVDNTIAVGDRIEAGDRLGRVGNSGVTLEPHLHVALLWYDPVQGRSYSVPATFRQIEVSPGPIGPWTDSTSASPDTGVWIR
jgi:murein DD-endopeptidase MepM/ murein hydrolase activator NlpD